MVLSRVLALMLVLIATGCGLMAPSEEELGGQYGKGRWCEQQTGTLCADFDDQLLPSDWDLLQNAPASLSIDTATFTSAPASLLSSSPAGKDARLRVTVPATAQRTRISFDLRLPEPSLSAGQNFTIVEFLCTDLTTYSGPWLQFHEPEGLVLRPFPQTLLGADAFPFDEWVHVTLDVRWGAVGRTSVELDGELLHDEESSFECTHPTFVLQVGLASVSGITGVSGHYDNVLYELTDG